VNANDIATTGAQPKWFLGALLLPEGTESKFVDKVFEDLQTACSQVGAELVGGHTEITSGLDRAILTGTMLGEVEKESLITPQGARPGDIILLSKGIPIEAGSILAREFVHRLRHLGPAILEQARNLLTDPGISVVKEALIASRVGGVTAMHDPTEGGLAAGLWELADAAGVGLLVDIQAIPIYPEAAQICRALSLDPFSAIASGALLLTVDQSHLVEVTSALQQAEIPIATIGKITDGTGVRMIDSGVEKDWPRPGRDALAMLFEGEGKDRLGSDDER
jgi:hydrogenase expression/formation protein HypE